MTCGSKVESIPPPTKKTKRFCVSTRQIRSGQARTLKAGPFRAQAQKESNLYDTNLNQLTLCAAKFDERFAMLTPKVAIHNSVSPSSQAFVPAVCLKFRFPRGGQFDMFEWGTIVKYVEPNVLAVVWQYVAPTSESSDNNYGTISTSEACH